MILDRFRLDGRASIVTGAGRGIGAATAVALAEAGADVLVSARSEDQLRDVAATIAMNEFDAHGSELRLGHQQVPFATGATAEGDDGGMLHQQ